jgi:N,N'-diacetyllegionaminate synthase
MARRIQVSNRPIGNGSPCFVIAEAGVNHNGSVERALELVDVASNCGADAVKFQTFKAASLASPSAAKAEYQLQDGSVDESQLEMLRRLELPAAAFARLKARCDQRGILFLSTPFEEESADLLESLDVPAFKIASGEITNLPFLKAISRKKRPILLSTGMATLSEVASAVDTIRSEGNPDLALLQCTSNYPADPATANLRAMLTMRDVFDVPAGYSDHTMGIEVALAAVALGAAVVEKHLTLNHDLPGPDHKASLTPVEFRSLVDGIRVVEKALGSGIKQPATSESVIAKAARKSLVAACDIQRGTVLSEKMICVRRPGSGLGPGQSNLVLNRRLRTDIPAGTVLTLDLFE